MSATPAAWLDRGVLSVLVARLLPLMAAPVALVLVATTRSPAEQGFYFILLNLQALAQLAELGTGALLVQFAARESDAVHWAHGDLAGDADAVARVRAVTRAAVAWYARAALGLALLAPLVVLALREEGARTGVAYGGATIAALLLTACYLPLVPLIAAAEGIGRLVAVQRMRLAQAALGLVALWSGILTVGAPWAVALLAAAWLLVAALWLARHAASFARALWRPGAHGADDVRRLRAAQWRTALHWLALWAAPQSLGPLLLRGQGAAAAGRAGLALALATAAATLGVSWLHARYPRLAALTAAGRHAETASLARRALGQALAVGAAVAVAITTLVAVAGVYLPALAARSLSPWGVAALGASALGWVVVHGVSAWLRAERAEPLWAHTVCGALAVIAASWWGAHAATPERAALAYAAAVLLVAAVIGWTGARRAMRTTPRLGRVDAAVDTIATIDTIDATPDSMLDLSSRPT
ncbi:hypothetical protein [Roseisolibacter agri]|uniref:Polysaccharide biosynthesis protein n=1 Tax=Roseisolibacter agri TaxID=2014610 RepID=A0AA37Q501_9BACT|nr:hypothetical protein [Roseisolibacter agri]GLC26705.1 hypothetical protein rosag_32180 [Roseisolibacter agri]